MTEHPYYVNELIVVTKRGLKAGIYGSIFAFISLCVCCQFVIKPMMDSVISQIDPSKIELLDTANKIYTMAVLDPITILGICIITGFISTIIFSKFEISLRMNYLKTKYKVTTWDETINIMRSKGMTYPWWENDMFWIESNNYLKDSIGTVK